MGTTLVVTWTHTAEQIESAYVADGTRLGPEILTIPDTDLTPEGRALLRRSRVDSCGRPALRVPGSQAATDARTVAVPIAEPRETPPTIGDVEGVLAVHVAEVEADAEVRRNEKTAREARDAAELARCMALTADPAAYVAGLPDEGYDATIAAPVYRLTLSGPRVDAVRAAAQIERDARASRAAAAALTRASRTVAQLRALGIADDRFDLAASPARPYGMGSEEDALGRLRAHYLPSVVGSVTARAKLRAEDVPHADECERPEEDGDECEVSFLAPRAETLTADEYARARVTLETLRAALPLQCDVHTPAVWEHLYRHTGTRECGGSVSQLEITVVLDLGDGIVLEREYLIA